MSSDNDSDYALDEKETRTMVTKQNRKQKKSGGFQAMGLSYQLYKGVLKKGYKVPTPIQRKCVPEILAGRDVVAMARTGSGKTAAFLIPMFEKLKQHVTTGSRALVLSPTRELALQTLKFIKELGKFTNLTATILLGGDKMEDQFSAMHSKPDIIVATPGRLLHIVMEMNLKLNSIEYVVFDEGDRLFEMGFAEQLQETLKRLSDNRQTVIFSATLPGVLIDFARAGLTEPKLIRLNVDNKLSEQLRMVYLTCTADDKVPALLHLLTQVIPKKQQTVVFVATKHHVEYLNTLLVESGLSCTYVYSDLDPEARKTHTHTFRTRQADILLVTDVAARGIDIPQLDNVINFNFPGKPKLFVHRVGRVARAGRSGTAYSLVGPDELPFLLDLHLFLGRDMRLAEKTSLPDEQALLGRIPQIIIDDQTALVRRKHSIVNELDGMFKVCGNAMKNYWKSRPNPSTESVRRIKEMNDLINQLPSHPILKTDSGEDVREDILAQLRAVRCPTTIFEARGRNSDPVGLNIMKAKRARYDGIVDKKIVAVKRKREEQSLVNAKKDKEFFIPYQREDEACERGLDIIGTNTFSLEANSVAMDLVDDAAGVGKGLQPVGSKKKWDRKKKKFIGESGEGRSKKIKTESGVWIPSSYKTKKYETWLKQSGVDADDARDSRGRGTKTGVTVLGYKPRSKKKTVGESSRGGFGRGRGKAMNQMIKPEQILKERKRVDKVKKFQKSRQLINKQKKKGKSR